MWLLYSIVTYIWLFDKKTQNVFFRIHVSITIIIRNAEYTMNNSNNDTFNIQR